jgi:glycosyltransferase involved in cell wall biosynthesis
MKILVNRRPVSGPWGGGNSFVKALIPALESSGHEVTHTLEPDIDCFFAMDPRPDSSCPGIGDFLQQFSHDRIPIVQRINECDARKNTEHMDSLLLQCSQYLHQTIFVSAWMQDYFLQKGWRCDRTTYIHNGVDKSIFKPYFRKKGPIKSVVAHHWSNNLLKGFDAYEFLDYLAGKGKLKFTYIGRHRDSFSNTEIIEPCTGKELAKNLALHDFYVSGSRFDPGPNHILEALAVGLPTYVHAKGGGAVEFAGKSHTFKNLSDLEKIALASHHEPNAQSPISWKESIESYIAVMEAL